MRKYVIKYNSRNCIEISKPINTTLIYKIPYISLKNKTHNIDIQNRFVVYILFGKNENGKDFVYVGKSKNGIDYRPTAHENKNVNWDICYVLTDIKERTILNDGTIQYLEDEICNRINEIKKYTNTTIQTTSGTANHFDMEECDEYLEGAYDMLYALGLDLHMVQQPDDTLITHSDNDVTLHSIRTKMQPLYNELIAEINKLNHEITLTPMKVYIKGEIDNRHLFDIASQSERLLIYFNAKKGELIDDEKLLEDMSIKGHHCSGDYRIGISDNSKMSEIIDFINQVINL